MQLTRIIVKEQNHKHDLKLAFSALDEDNKGYFTIEELEEAFERMPGRERLDEADVNCVLDSADPNGDGIIDFKGDLVSTGNFKQVIQLLASHLCVFLSVYTIVFQSIA